jgi:hypothetical protein
MFVSAHAEDDWLSRETRCSIATGVSPHAFRLPEVMNGGTERGHASVMSYKGIWVELIGIEPTIS